MTDNAENKDDAGSGSIAVDAKDDVDARDEHTDVADEATEDDDFAEDQAESEDDGLDEDDAPGTGALSGGFGFAGLALGLVSLTTNWTSGVVVNHSQYNKEVHAPSSGLSTQQQLNLYTNGWHTQGWWALVFAIAAVLCGAGAVFVPRFLLRRNPGWAKAAGTAAVIVGVVGALLAVLTIVGVFGGHLTAPAAPTTSG